MKIENVIFDLDGTLLDTTEGVLESAVFAAKALGYEELSHDTMLKFIGPPIQNSFMEFYGCDEETAQKAANIFRSYYKNKALLKAVPYNGIYDLCEKLKNQEKRIAVATYKREDYALTILKHFGFDRFCISMHGADNNNNMSKADIIDLCIKELGGNRDRTVLIGDTDHDAIGAQVADVHFIAVTYGFGYKNRFEVKYPNIGVASIPIEVLQYIV